MVFLGNGIAISGIELESTICRKKNDNELEELTFLSNPIEKINEEDFNILSYQLTPFAFNSNSNFYCFKTRILEPGKQYNVSGMSGARAGKVYISKITEEDPDFSDPQKLLYTTTISNNIFNFNFTQDELVFPEVTRITIWMRIYSYAELMNFTVNLSQVISMEDQNFVVLKHSAPVDTDEQQHILAVNGSLENLENVNGVLIYDSNLNPDSQIDELAQVYQDIIIDGFESLQNGEKIKNYAAFKEALIQRGEAQARISNSSEGDVFYSIEMSQLESEQYTQATHFYLWSTYSKEEDQTLTREIHIDEKTEDPNYEGLDISWLVCLSGDTPINMADGTIKELQMLEPGELVLDVNGGETKVIRVNHGSFNPYHTLYTFENDIIIDEISTHRFYNVEKGYWEHLSKWKIGDHALDINGNKIKLISRQRIYETKENFGLDTESGRYYANGLLSGPARCNRDLLKHKTLKEAIGMLGSIKNFQKMSLLDMGEII